MNANEYISEETYPHLVYNYKKSFLYTWLIFCIFYLFNIILQPQRATRMNGISLYSRVSIT